MDVQTVLLNVDMKVKASVMIPRDMKAEIRLDSFSTDFAKEPRIGFVR